MLEAYGFGFFKLNCLRLSLCWKHIEAWKFKQF